MVRDDTGRVCVLLELTLANMAVLWDGAARVAGAVHAMTDDEVMEMLGPRDDPDATACAAMLFDTVVKQSGAIDTPTIKVTRFDEEATWSADTVPASGRRRGATGG
ncbi:hypothetical protein ASG11_05555 [Sphingomonas sp. Leaf357]|uniref:hypothetical protein n=1 Tax=Sphingomonas sp. Leaf357 TaxID=1736350 RepID=UPI0006F289E7|nr:hypothetical protein [Sphingomonas sp. Leaf357]KQS03774.1 hypothetical protein ASG11_05555 [Sphingomonas sp. Leaf357]